MSIEKKLYSLAGIRITLLLLKCTIAIKSMVEKSVSYYETAISENKKRSKNYELRWKYIICRINSFKDNKDNFF